MNAPGCCVQFAGPRDAARAAALGHCRDRFAGPCGAARAAALGHRRVQFAGPCGAARAAALGVRKRRPAGPGAATLDHGGEVMVLSGSLVAPPATAVAHTRARRGPHRAVRLMQLQRSGVAVCALGWSGDVLASCVTAASRAGCVRVSPPAIVRDGRRGWRREFSTELPFTTAAHLAKRRREPAGRRLRTPSRAAKSARNRLGSEGRIDGRSVDGRSVDGRSVGGRSVDGRSVEGRSVDGRSVGGRSIDGHRVDGRSGA